MAVEELPIDAVRIDGGTQQRALSEDAVADYADRLDDLPAVQAVYDGKDCWLWDGFHRYHAHRRAGRAKIRVNVAKGTKRDAFLKSLGANEGHGVRRTNADKRATVERALADEELIKWADTKLAALCRVSQPFVSEVRRHLVTQNVLSEPTSERTYTTRHGTTATMNTTKIGKGGDRQGKAGKGTAAPPPAADPLDEEGSSDVAEDEAPAPVKAAPAEKGSAPETAEPKGVAEFDIAGNRIPTAEIADVFRAGEAHQGAALQLLTQVSKLINPVVGKDASPIPCGYFAVSERQHILTDLANLKTALKQTRPYSVCPYCAGSGKKCQGCKGQGWVAESTYRAAPADYRERLAKAAKSEQAA